MESDPTPITLSKEKGGKLSNLINGILNESDVLSPERIEERRKKYEDDLKFLIDNSNLTRQDEIFDKITGLVASCVELSPKKQSYPLQIFRNVLKYINQDPRQRNDATSILQKYNFDLNSLQKTLEMI